VHKVWVHVVLAQLAIAALALKFYCAEIGVDPSQEQITPLKTLLRAVTTHEKGFVWDVAQLSFMWRIVAG